MTLKVKKEVGILERKTEGVDLLPCILLYVMTFTQALPM
jgi:hypothetical protein